MAKNNSTLFYIIAALGGTFLFYELTKMLSKDKYLCPKCGKTIKYKDSKCKHCNEPLEWNF